MNTAIQLPVLVVDDDPDLKAGTTRVLVDSASTFVAVDGMAATAGTVASATDRLAKRVWRELTRVGATEGAPGLIFTFDVSETFTPERLAGAAAQASCRSS